MPLTAPSLEARQPRQPGIAETHRLDFAHGFRVVRKPSCAKIGFDSDDLLDPCEEPGIIAANARNLVDAGTAAERFGNDPKPIGRLPAPVPRASLPLGLER